MNPQQPPHQSGGWNNPQPGHRLPGPGQPQSAPPGAAGLSRIPLLPAVLGALLVVGSVGCR
ncbi:MAG: hypothetical protein LBE07_08910 [Gordonia sp. (in: high G+C Gram-positive bacteria)]|nr:hypothetical protein [Gordonia sp. (in: high G+C Gram-positive bacteria)]